MCTCACLSTKDVIMFCSAARAMRLLSSVSKDFRSLINLRQLWGHLFCFYSHKKGRIEHDEERPLNFNKQINNEQLWCLQIEVRFRIDQPIYPSPHLLANLNLTPLKHGNRFFSDSYCFDQNLFHSILSINKKQLSN